MIDSMKMQHNSLQFTQKDVDNLKSLEEKLDTSKKEIDQLKSTLLTNHFHKRIRETKAVETTSGSMESQSLRTKCGKSLRRK